ncbi:prepilin-type N-terminal cleavage/methylation domain-containing protein [Marinobacter halodurans]|uniref:Prepilin-type N-terminal cleavage/methylation domain-containing protein n=1 Tax=Marinobacter halodurans TaxID=2528979 RepID=A0ABY1ZJY7_9GAMM|nr:prepilin-type N-terminal cleavage/methylation domain-containing protein [Marinobacter halodurans]TBW55429.1 prepilin-type N-terminal cleavage/methylation domain-containing protein [Marinobacter halodurans]
MVRRYERGLSLIELMVVMTIIMILALLAAPLGAGWVKSTHLNHAHDVLKEAYATARALALRNTANVSGNAVAATLRVNGNKLSVDYPDPDDSTKVLTLWSGQVDTDTTVALGDAPGCAVPNTLALTARGLPADLGCVHYTLTIKGGPSDAGTLQ